MVGEGDRRRSVQIDEWLKTGEKELRLAPCNSFQRRITYQEVAKRSTLGPALSPLSPSLSSFSLAFGCRVASPWWLVVVLHLAGTTTPSTRLRRATKGRTSAISSSAA